MVFSPLVLIQRMQFGELPEDELIQLTGLTTEEIRRIRARAVDTGVRLDHFISMVEESTTHRPFAPSAIYTAGDVPRSRRY
jgi:hypothetical protein